jgi:hypothetical protein
MIFPSLTIKLSVMKKIMCFFICLFAVLRLCAQNITAAEYFFDTDPGPGLGHPIDVGTAGTVVNFTTSISTASLATGFHTLAIRTKDQNNTWGLFETRTVYISGNVSAASQIVAAEFFFDADPGTGSGTQLGVNPGTSVNFVAVIPATSLSPGFHTLAIRTKNAEGYWGLFETRGFYISDATTNASAITAAEYFIDNDPGTGNGTALAVGTAGNTVSFTASIPTNTLAAGFHTLAIRTRNAEGYWSLYETKGFYISAQTTDMSPVTAAEYFLDTDPGTGKGAPLSFTTPGNTVSRNFLIPVPAGTPGGPHLLAIRTKDADGNWGLFEVTEILVDGFPLPLSWLSFTAKREETKVALQWKTANESHTSYFDIERSTNGVGFSSIGRVTAKALAENDYAFFDLNPATGINYYRLKQVDTDGTFKYSVIVKTYYGDNTNELHLYPQPAGNSLQVVFGGKGAEVFVQVFDATGRMVLNERKQNSSIIVMNTERIAPGTYWILVSDGITQQKGRFIKQ